jgi:TatD DNase family protein
MHPGKESYRLLPMPDIHLIDAHCHLDFESFSDDFEMVMQRAKDKNISDIIIPGTQKKTWQRITKLADNHANLHPAYGLHPYWARQHDKTDIDALEQYIASNPAVAVGECGLDFRAQQADQELQLYFFEAQLKIAESRQLPVIIHSVNATETVIKSIKKFNGVRGMIHSYSGSVEQARQLIELGFFISISGSVTYDNAKKVRSVAKDIPLKSLLIETDAPDQPDKSHQGLRNEPAFITNTLEVITGLRNEPVEVIAAQTSANAKQLFHI